MEHVSERVGRFDWNEEDHSEVLEEGYNPIPSSVAMLLQILVDISGSRYGEEKFGLDEEISILEDE